MLDLARIPLRITTATAASLLLSVCAAAAMPKEKPSAVVNDLHETFLDVMRQAEELGYEGRLARLRPAVVEAFDISFMARHAVGRTWNDLDPQQRQRWVGAFERFVSANYAARFKGFSGQSFRTNGQEDAPRDTVIVRTTLVDPEGENVDLDYRLQRDGETWRIIDIYLKGTVSQLALRRSDYAATLQSGGIDALIASLEERIAELSAGATPPAS